MTLSDERLTLLPAKPPLAKAVLDYYLRNRDFLAPFDPIREESFYTLAYQRRALRRDAAMARKGEGWAFYIAPNAEPGKLIGRVALTGAIWGSFCSCFLGYKLDKDYLNRGYMTGAIGLVTAWGFEVGLHRIEANIMPRNLPSLRVAEKCGFQNEGLSPRYLQINGKWEDHVHMVKLNPDWSGWA